MTKALPRFKTRVAVWELIPSSGGRFEVTVNDELVYSKLATGEFPDEDQIIKTIADRL